jgi:hypothetical protein
LLPSCFLPSCAAAACFSVACLICCWLAECFDDALLAGAGQGVRFRRGIRQFIREIPAGMPPPASRPPPWRRCGLKDVDDIMSSTHTGRPLVLGEEGGPVLIPPVTE